jgi:hypothetical protein
MRTRRILALLVGSAMALTLAGAAFAVDNNTPLNQTGTAIDGTTFDQDCVIPPGVTAPAPGEVLWHFIFTGDQDGISGHFEWSTGGVDEVSVDQGANQAWWLITPWDTTLDGSATFTDGVGGEFTLSHTCFVPAPTPTPTPTPTLPPTSTVPGTPTSPSGTNMNLVLGLILLIAGGVTAVAMRPRRGTR